MGQPDAGSSGEPRDRGRRSDHRPARQGTGNSVGLAIAQKFFAATFNTPEFAVSDHRVYTIVSDGDLEEGISHEAAALAGPPRPRQPGLVLRTTTASSIEGYTKLSYSDDVPSRFKGYHWHVISINGNDQSQIDAALKEAQATKGQPTIIIGKTIIGKGSPKLQGTPKAHSDAFGAEEVAATKRNLGWPTDAQFLVPERVKAFFAEKRKEWAKEERTGMPSSPSTPRRSRQGATVEGFPGQEAARQPRVAAAEIPHRQANRHPQRRRRRAQGPARRGAEPHRRLGGSRALDQDLDQGIRLLREGQLRWPHPPLRHPRARHGRDLRRHRLLRRTHPFGSTFFVFTDYMRPPIRLAALSSIQTIYIFTHDSICVGEDAPTHEPVEQLATVRAIPRVIDLRPGDANETSYAWLAALEHKTQPTCILLTRQNLPSSTAPRSRPPPACSRAATCSGSRRPAHAGHHPDRHRLGSFPRLRGRAEDRRRGQGRPRRLTAELAALRGPAAELPRQRAAAGSDQARGRRGRIRQGWERYITTAGKFVGVEKFGASAPYERVLKEYGITTDHVLEVAKSLL